MKTKEEYKNALDRMEKAYFDLDNSLSAMDSFNKDIHLFADLINDLFANVINKHYEEKQEIKQETNFEHFKEEITKLDFSFAVRNGKVVPCEDCHCKECYFKKFAENSPLLVWEMNRHFCFPRFVCIILYVS